MFRGTHRLTKIQSKISKIKIEPYYPRHKDSTHYVVTFRVKNFTDRLAIYIGNQNQIANSKLIPLLDTNKVYTLVIDKTEPVYDRMILAVKKMILDDKTIYKSSRLLTMAGGIFAFILGIFWLFYKNRPKTNGS